MAGVPQRSLSITSENGQISLRPPSIVRAMSGGRDMTGSKAQGLIVRCAAG